MTTKVIMPQMGESIVEGTITKWLKKVGDKIGRDEPLFEISTDKVDSEIPSPAAGVVTEILVPEGQTVKINTVVAVIEEEMSAAAAAAPAAAPPPPKVEEKPAQPVPQAAPSAPPTRPPAPPEQPPAPAPAPEPPPAAPMPPAPAAAQTPRGAAVVQPRDIRTSPLVRRLARENNIDLSDVRGTGLDGRITKEDVLSYLEQRAAKPEPAAAAPPAPEAPAAEPKPELPAATPPPPAAAVPEARPAARVEPATVSQAAPPATPPAVEPAPFYGEAETVNMTQMRKTIAERMVASKRTSAHVNTVFEVDMTSIVQLVGKHKQEFERREGVKLTYTPFFVKALVDTVREFPVLNCSVSGDRIIYKKPINVGVAVALDTGLIVPVVKDAHLKSFTGIVLAVADLAERARTKRLRPDDVQNGTVSITNPGIYGSLFGTPIINQPQVAILGVGGIEKRPVVVNDAIAIRPMVYLSLSFDHRVIDGAVADQFMAKLKTRLQSWAAWVD